MQRRILFFLCSVFLLFVYGPAWGITIDTLENIGPNGSTITQRIIGNVTVDLTVGSGGSLVAGTYYDSSFFLFGGATESLNRNNDPLNPSNVSLSRFFRVSGVSATSHVAPIIFDFSAPIKEFGLTTIDLLENKGGGDDWVTIYAYDRNGNIVDEHTRIGRQGPSGLDLDWYVNSSEYNIVQAQMVSHITNYSGHGIDDIYINSVPEPATFILFILGLLNLAYLNRKA